MTNIDVWVKEKSTVEIIKINEGEKGEFLSIDILYKDTNVSINDINHILENALREYLK